MAYVWDVSRPMIERSFEEKDELVMLSVLSMTPDGAR
jgi:hypothetical protein